MRALVVLLAASYVLPAWSVFKRVANERDRVSIVALKADGQLTASAEVAKDVAGQLGSAWTSGDLVLTATWSMKLPGRCRLDVSSPDSSKALAFVWANGKARSEGGEWPAAQVAVAEACQFLALHSAADGESHGQLEKHVAALKVDTKQTSLGRLGNEVATVVGDRAANAPQVWISKGQTPTEGFDPVRVRFTDEKGAQWDVKLIDYASPATADWFPRIIEVSKDGVAQLKFTVLAADGKPNLESVKF
jgi:hypothetical protein